MTDIRDMTTGEAEAYRRGFRGGAGVLPGGGAGASSPAGAGSEAVNEPKVTDAQRLADFVAGMEAAVDIMRRMAAEPSVASVSGPAALRIVADALEESARQQREPRP